MSGMRVYQNLGIGDSAEMPGHFSADPFRIYGTEMNEKLESVGGVFRDVLSIDIVRSEDPERLGPQYKEGSRAMATTFLVGQNVYGPFMNEAGVKNHWELLGKEVAVYLDADSSIIGIMPV